MGYTYKGGKLEVYDYQEFKILCPYLTTTLISVHLEEGKYGLKAGWYPIIGDKSKPVA